MNPLFEEYFDSVEICLIESPAVSSYTLIRREISPVDGKLRIKTELDDGWAGAAGQIQFSLAECTGSGDKALG